jgi:hypothetical protein
LSALVERVNDGVFTTTGSDNEYFHERDVSISVRVSFNAPLR